MSNQSDATRVTIELHPVEPFFTTKKDGTGGRPSDRLRSVYSTLSFSCFQNEALMDIEIEMAST